MKMPKQIEPQLDPEKPTSKNRYLYYLMEKPNSPSITPPNAVRVVQYEKAQYLHDAPYDFRQPYGFVEYDHELTFQEVEDYNLLPFDRDTIIFYDLWRLCSKNTKRMEAAFDQYFRMLKEDPEGKCVGMVINLVTNGWTSPKVKAAVKKLKAGG